MKLSEVKENLATIKELKFKLPDGTYVADHFHVTEVGQISKSFIDCGGVIRHEKKVNFQLWEADDYNHRLHPEKLENIINLSIDKLNIEDAEVEVEYQGETIQKFGIEFNLGEFHLMSTHTDCLARDKCNVPLQKVKVDLSSLTADACCTPGGGCC
ncbi:MAG: DUF6428 family protein [Saprospiraceae bacterium]|nr:DUF6428 family protein [Saprospiraceae bacterium]